jgi:hypothetical protein
MRPVSMRAALISSADAALETSPHFLLFAIYLRTKDLARGRLPKLEPLAARCDSKTSGAEPLSRQSPAAFVAVIAHGPRPSDERDRGVFPPKFLEPLGLRSLAPLQEKFAQVHGGRRRRLRRRRSLHRVCRHPPGRWGFCVSYCVSPHQPVV